MGAFGCARPLKEMCRSAFNPLARYLNEFLPEAEQITEASFFENKVPASRLLLQAVGTDIVRKVDVHYWSHQAVINIRNHKEPIVIMTDWRFPSELETMRCFHTHTVRILRDIPRPEGHNLHVSETALDGDVVFNRVVHNNGTLGDLRYQAQELAYHLIEESME